MWIFNTLRPRQNCCHFADDIFKCISSQKFVPMGRINNIPSLAQIMAGRRPGDKPSSETMMVSLLTHICVTQLQWVKSGDVYAVFFFSFIKESEMWFCDVLHWRNWIAIESSFWEVPHFYADTLSIKLWRFEHMVFLYYHIRYLV